MTQLTEARGARAACCGREVPGECLEGVCQHGRPPMWNTGSGTWEIPAEGPCGRYRTAGREVRHLDCVSAAAA